VKGESLDLVKYIDNNFEGPSLLPDVRQIYSISISAMRAKIQTVISQACCSNL
jgi:hypothetical protein